MLSLAGIFTAYKASYLASLIASLFCSETFLAPVHMIMYGNKQKFTELLSTHLIHAILSLSLNTGMIQVDR